MMWKQLMLLLMSAVVNSQQYRILGLFPHPASSHVNVFLPIMSELANRGHEVTVLSHYNLPKPVERYRELHLENPEGDLVGKVDMNMFRGFRFQKYLNNVLLAYLGWKNCDLCYNSSIVRDLIESEEKYDLVIMEFFNTDCLAPFAHKFKAPLIGLSSCTMMPWLNSRFANPDHPAYIPINHMDYSDKMTFFERVENTVTQFFNDLLFNRILRHYENGKARQFFGDDIPDLSDIVNNASLMLMNTHFSLTLPRPQVPGVIDIGGVHVKKPKTPPQDLDRWINESTHGVIYFSLGSMIKGHTFPAEKRQEFLRAFGRLPQRILWKWENDTMPGKPDNVMIQKWMPQLDILCHPNVKAFISHGGLLGTTEAVHCGVPIVVMPQFGDQFTNARALEEVGGGVILDLHTATEDKVYDALRTVLQPSFRKGAEELSARFRDRPLPPLETAIYWVEYVARHRGAHHMRTAAVGMPIYKYLLLDVIAFLVIVLAAISAVTFVIARAVLRKIFVKKNKAKTD